MWDRWDKGCVSLTHAKSPFYVFGCRHSLYTHYRSFAPCFQVHTYILKRNMSDISDRKEGLEIENSYCTPEADLHGS